MPQAIPYIVMGTAAAVGAGSSIMAGKAAESEAKYNADLKDREAIIIEQNVEENKKIVNFEVGQLRKNFNQFRGQNVVNYAKGNIELSGTVETVMRENLERYLDDEYNFKYNAKKQETEALDGAAMTRLSGEADRIRGKYQKKASYLQAGQSLLQGASNMYSYNALGPTNTSSSSTTTG